MLDKKGVAKYDRTIYEKREAAWSTLARLSRATGINLFLGVQRPDANVLTGQIKNNVPVRICGRFADKPASEIVLGNSAACDLPEIKGRFIYKMGNETFDFQSFYFDDEQDLHEIDVKQGDLLTEMNGTESSPTPASETVVLQIKPPTENSANKKSINTKPKISINGEVNINFDFSKEE
jgi:S-DNA-T family DNA segregation ATPase FtsK/SpoIIIE